MDELPINAAEIINHQIDRLIDSSGKFFAKQGSNIKSKIRVSYRSYLARIFEKYSQSKTFFYYHTPKKIKSFYVDRYFKYDDNRLKLNFQNLLSISEKVIITGPAGIGKTMAINKMVIQAIESKSKIPVILTLRNLNNFYENFEDFISDQLKCNGLDVDENFLEKSYSSGQYVFFLDGFEEINYDTEEARLNEIKRFSELYPKNIYILTSRPDRIFSALTNYIEVNIEPLDNFAISELIMKLEEQVQLKEKFLNFISENRISSIFTNPLLLTASFSIFQNRYFKTLGWYQLFTTLFETLFEVHDLTKSAVFRRQRSVSLSKMDYEKVLSILAINTYLNEKELPTTSYYIQLLASIKEKVSFEFKENEFLQSLVQDVSILEYNNMLLSYSHPLFEKYFAARYIWQQTNEIKIRVYNAILSKGYDVEIFNFLIEVDEIFILEYIIIPAIDKIKDILKNSNIDQINSHSILVSLIELSIDRFKGTVELMSNQKQDEGFTIKGRMFEIGKNEIQLVISLRDELYKKVEISKSMNSNLFL